MLEALECGTVEVSGGRAPLPEEGARNAGT